MVSAADPVGPYLPWGVHLAYGADGRTSMSVMWSTRSDPGAPSEAVVAVAASGAAVAHFAATSKVFTDSGNTQSLHNTTMTGLAPGTAYSYTVGSTNGNVSGSFTFRTQPAAADGAWVGGRAYPVLAIYGDMGVGTNAHKTLPLLAADAAAGRFDVALHVGDVAYDIQSNNGGNGDAFVVNTQAYAATHPVHLCPGNHGE